MRKTITLFGSSRPKPGTSDYLFAYRVGAALARAGFTLCNGGYGGTMEAAARGAKEAGGKTLGIIFSKQGLHANPYIDRVEKKRTLLGRLERLVRLADGYLVFKGGTGTLLEVSLVLEYTHKKFSLPKPMVFVGNSWRKTVETARRDSRRSSSSPFPPKADPCPSGRRAPQAGKTEADGMKNFIRFVTTPHTAVRALQKMLREGG